MSAMRDLPIIFPISLAVLLAVMLFTSAYAISANAVSDQSAAAGVSRSADDNSVFERGALLVCPFH